MTFSMTTRWGPVAATVLATALLASTPVGATTAAEGPTSARVVTAAKRCETPGGHPNTHVCIRYKRDNHGQHWARATIRNDLYPGDGPVDIAWVRLLRFNCGTGEWKVVRKKEGSHTYQSYEATLNTRKYTDFYRAVRWRAVQSWVIQEPHGSLSGEIRTKPVGSCTL